MINLIDFIKGSIEYIGEDYVVIENGAIGYRVYTSQYSMAKLNEDMDNVILYTQMIVREDDISLCGFASRQELKMFELLKTVKGVGTKVALGILSTIPFVELANILISADVNNLTKAPGIGKKTAQRIILELKDKVNKSIAIEEGSMVKGSSNFIMSMNANDEVIEALLTLGYGKSEAQEVVSRVDSDLSVEDKIKEALKLLMK